MFTEELTAGEYQQKTFNEISQLEHRIRHLAGFVQNNYGSMFRDEIITKDSIKESIPEMEKEFDEVVTKISLLKGKVKKILEHYSE